ncbi:MAG: ImmA/IrrE family metallo-endopeptidase, partial [Gammaproteobacteria bacterium]
PRIHLSALRPLARRTFNCAHELGHHEFGHGSTIDELRDDASAEQWHQPNEVLANAFAAFVLMPTLGLRQAFARRHLTPETATPTQLYAIACNFGVGLSTLTTHMAFGIEAMTPFRRTALARHTPRSVRAEFLGHPAAEPLILVDEQWNAPSLDAEEGHLIWLSNGVQVTGKVLIFERAVQSGSLFRAIAPGIGRAFHPDGSWATYVRVARREYVGLAEYRHLEDATDD